METQDKSGMYIKYGFAAVGLFAAYKLLQKIGLIPTAEQKQVENLEVEATASTTQVNQSNPVLAFSPSYRATIIEAYKKKYGNTKGFEVTKQLKGLDFAALAKKIYDSKGTFKDDKPKLYSVFNTMQTQYQLSYLAGVFSAAYKKDLYQYLKTFLDDDEILPVLNIVKNYPLYFT